MDSTQHIPSTEQLAQPQNSNSEKPRTYAINILWPILIVLLPSFLVGFLFSAFAPKELEGQAEINWLSSAFVSSLMYIVAAFIGFFVLKFATKTANWREYIGLMQFGSVNRKGLFVVFLLTLGYSIFESTLGYMLDVPYPEFMLWMKETTYGLSELLMLVLAVCIVAPIYEEMIFRGFLHEKLSRGRLSPLSINILISISFTSLHVQYQWSVLLMLFGFSLLLGHIRQVSGNLNYAIWGHCVMNTLSTLYLFTVM